MSSHDDKDLLAQALRERAAGMSGSVDLDAVKGRARGIQRRRRAVTGLVAAAVIAVAVPVGLNVTDGMRSTAPVPANPSPSVVESGDPTPSPRPTPRADGTFPLTVQSLSRGDDTGVPYLRGDQLLTSRETLRLPEPYGMIAPYDGGYLAVGSAENPGEVLFLDSDLDVTRTEPDGGYALAVSHDGTRVAYVVRQTDTKVLLVNAPTDGTDPTTWSIEVPGRETLEPVGFLDDDTVVYQDELGNVMGIAGPGDDLTPIEGFLRLDDTSETTGLVSGLVSYGNDGGCSGVMDPASGTLLWESCDHSRLRFSPDGRHVVADASYYDGPGSPTLSLLDASTGDEVATFSPEPGGRTVVGVMQATWEDDDSVVAYVEEGRDQAMLRLGLDGSVERVTDVVTVRGMVVEMWFAEEPR